MNDNQKHYMEKEMKQFTPMTVIRLSANNNLKSLFDSLGITCNLDWEQATKSDIMDFVGALKPSDAKTLHSVLREIHLFGNHPFAESTARKLAELRNLSLPPHFSGPGLRYDQGVILRTGCNLLWRDTMKFLKADSTPVRSWKFVKNIDIAEVKTDADTIKRLCRIISAFFVQRLTCGQHFEVEYLLRSPGVHYFFLNFKALAGTYEHWNDENRRIFNAECHSLPVILSCDENKREIAAYAEGGCEVTMPLLRFFAKIVLRTELPETDTGIRNNIEQMKYGDFSFIYDFDSGIEFVKCRAMTLDIIGRPGKGITLNVPENGSLDEIVKSLMNDLNHDNLPLELLVVKSVVVQVKMKNDISRNGVMLYITPKNDPLRKLDEGKHFTCGRLLRESRINDCE